MYSARHARGHKEKGHFYFILFSLACRARCALKLELSHTVKGHRRGDLIFLAKFVLQATCLFVN